MKSEETLLKAIKQDPDNIDKYWDLAQWYRQNNDQKKLQFFLDAVIQRFYFVAGFIYMRAQLFIANQAWSKAELDIKRCIELNPNNAMFHDTLGVIFQKQERYDKALISHKKAIDLDSNHNGFLFNYAVANDKAGKNNIAKHCYKGLLDKDKKFDAAKLNLAVLLKNEGDYEQAKELLIEIMEQSPQYFSALMELGDIAKKRDNVVLAREWYSKAKIINPDFPEVTFVLNALDGITEESPPPTYIRNLFDDFADSFEDRLVNKLQYTIPHEMFLVLKSHLKPNLNWLDLGAGTGLLSHYLKPYCENSVAVDLSSNMLAKAQNQNLYDTYICDDIEQAMRSMEASKYDLISAADVFVYLGNLEPVFSQVVRLLKAGGLFIFTTEHTTDKTHDYCIKDTMRYGHAVDYLKRLGAEAGLTLIQCDEKVIRTNKGQPVKGNLCLFINKKGCQ